MQEARKMSRAEAGRKGGQTTKKRYGDDFFGKIGRLGGRKGGETTKQRYGIEVHNHLLADDIPHEVSQLSGPLRDLSAAPAVLGLEGVTVDKPTVLTNGDDGVVLVLAPAEEDVDVAQVAEL